MSKNRLEISDSTAISMPMKNLIAIVAAVSMGVWAYFGVLERITMLETTSKLAEKDLNQHVERLEADLTKNTEFRIKWPRGEMGTLPADSEQYMLIEDIYGSVEKIEKQLKKGVPTIPSTLKEELECNIFLRAKDVESFSKLRDLKDNF